MVRQLTSRFFAYVEILKAFFVPEYRHVYTV
uniref:Uncharacterized protein n=1 Tax=Anguilla anguilla TaxID=7936 RepID=A0A0E9RQF8_ANGAN